MNNKELRCKTSQCPFWYFGVCEHKIVIKDEMICLSNHK